MKMIHWDTLQEKEDECRSDNGGTQMIREDDAVFLNVQSDLLAGPKLLATCEWVLDWLSSFSMPPTSTIQEKQEAMAVLQKAIAQAKGETHE